MTTQYVQFSDATEAKIQSIFGCPQNANDYPNQGQVDSSDPRFIAFANPAATLSGAQAIQIGVLQAAYVAAVNLPVSYTNAAGVTSTYAAGASLALNGQTANQNLLDAIALGSKGWKLGLWLDSNSVAQTFTFADLQGLADAMGNAVQLDWSDLVSKIAAVQAATSVSEVQAITF